MATQSNFSLGCSCKIPHPLMMNESMTAMGRGRGHSSGGRGGALGFVLGLLVLIFVLPQLIAALQAVLAAVGIGRSLPMPVDMLKTNIEERKEQLERVLKQLQAAGKKLIRIKF